MSQSILFRGGKILGVAGGEIKASVTVEGGKITAIGKEADRRGRRRAHGFKKVDLKGAYLTPGFVDLHTHGAIGIDFYEAEAAELDRSAREHYLVHGVTRLLVSLYPGPKREFLNTIRRVSTAIRSGAGGGVLAGIHLEGPYLDPGHPGALPVRYFQTYTPSNLSELLDAGQGTVKTMTIAPERPGGLRLIKALKSKGIIPAFGHTGADYAQARKAIDKGIDYVTHLFNAMDGIHHRKPGPISAFLQDPKMRLELISDGFHVNPEVLKWVTQILQPEQICLVSDSVAPCGLKPGTYKFAGEDVKLKKGQVIRKDGTIAGSALTMDQAFKLQVEEIGRSPWEVALSASTTPAKIAGWQRSIGAIAPNKKADLVILDSKFKVKATYLGGEEVYKA